MNDVGTRTASDSRTFVPVPLLVEHEIVRLRSASTLAVLRRETAQRKAAKKSVAVVAEPVFDSNNSRFVRTAQVVEHLSPWRS